MPKHDAHECDYHPEVGHEVVSVVIEDKSADPEQRSPSVWIEVMGREPGFFRLGGTNRRLLALTVA